MAFIKVLDVFQDANIGFYSVILLQSAFFFHVFRAKDGLPRSCQAAQGIARSFWAIPEVGAEAVV